MKWYRGQITLGSYICIYFFIIKIFNSWLNELFKYLIVIYFQKKTSGVLRRFINEIEITFIDLKCFTNTCIIEILFRILITS